MQRYEYTTHFEPIEYETEAAGVLIFKQTKTAYDAPLAEAFAQHCNQVVFPRFGEDGWELISTECVWGTRFPSGNPQSEGFASSHQVIKGYLMFWKRPVQPVAA